MEHSSKTFRRKFHSQVPARRGQFKNKQEGMSRRKRIWTCLNCLTQFAVKQATPCGKCGSAEGFQHFPSKAEANRYATLRLMQEHNQISDLECQPSFPLLVAQPSGKFTKIATYYADFRYREGSKTVIEDVKGLETDVFKLKKKHAEAQYGITINIVKAR